jgi:myo-inositol-hexaphosphate 3-phosphohydrolase
MSTLAAAERDAVTLLTLRKLHNPAVRDQDDLAFWYDSQQPADSRCLVSDKAAHRLFVYDLAGRLQQTLEVPKPGNIDIRQGVTLGDRRRDIVAVNSRQANDWSVHLFEIDPATRQLSPLGRFATQPNYGGCLAADPSREKLWFICTSEAHGAAQYAIEWTKDGKCSGRAVRRWPLGKCEGAVADDAAGVLYIAIEEEGLWRAPLDPASPDPGRLVAPIGTRGLAADLEGITLATWTDGRPALIVSVQGRDRFVALERNEPWHAIGEFQVEGAVGTDGIDLLQTDRLEQFPGGIFGCHTDAAGHPILLAAWGALDRTQQVSAAQPTISYLGTAEWPGTARDRSGLTDPLEDGSPHDRLGGLGSGIAWTGRGDAFVMVSDRGPGDGAVSCRCRTHAVTITVDPQRSPAVRWELTGTTLLTGPKSLPLIGLAAAHTPMGNRPAQRFDPEAIRITREGTWLIADEYGPSIREFDSQGRWLKDWPLPEGFTVAQPGATPETELPPHNTRGRQPNRGLEGLALTPDGKAIAALMQGPLLQDGAIDAEQKRIGRIVRLLLIERDTGRTTQYAYLLENPAYGLNEIEALDDRRFLVIERDGNAGTQAVFKRIALIDLADATPLDPQQSFPEGTLPATVQPVDKRWFLDLLDPRWGLAGEAFPEKTEGLALGRTLPDGRRLLFITSDNDFQPNVPSRVDVFAIPARP